MNAKSGIGTVFAVVVGVIAYQASVHGTKGLFGGSIESKLASTAVEMNKKLPQQIDQVTRLDRVESGPGKEFSYFYTITVNLTDAEKTQLQNMVTQKALSTPEMKNIFDAGVTVWYKYLDASGKTALAFSVKR